jgi:ABC-2 type transport system permease protein
MKLSWRLASLKNGLQDATAYRIEFLFEVLSSAMVPAVIQCIFWYAMFTLGHQTTVVGMTYHEAIQYTFVSLLFTQIRGGDLDFELAEMIRTGQLSNYLLRPVGVVEFVYLRGLAPKLFIATLSLVIGMAASFYFHVLSPGRMLGAMFLALIGNIIHYQISVTLAAMSFLWEDAYGILMVKNMVVSLLSGELLPLTLFPARLSWIWKVTPFYLYVFGPTWYALGRWSHVEFLHQLGFAGLWLIGGYIAIRITWGLGIKHYSSLGS